MRNMITREEAISAMYTLINTGILEEDLEETLQEIANAIEHERCGSHTWGADAEEYATLVTSRRADLITAEYAAEKKRIVNKYAFEPSPFEKTEIGGTIDSEEQ